MHGRIAVLLAAGILASAGCATTEPVSNVVDAPIGSAKALSMSEVQRAITTAGHDLGWTMQSVGPGKLSGRLMLRTHVAEVEIEHSTRAYSITYRDSQNLEARDGKIHRQYNTWVENLDKAIQAQLTNAANFK